MCSWWLARAAAQPHDSRQRLSPNWDFATTLLGGGILNIVRIVRNDTWGGGPPVAEFPSCRKGRPRLPLPIAGKLGTGRPSRFGITRLKAQGTPTPQLAASYHLARWPPLTRTTSSCRSLNYVSALLELLLRWGFDMPFVLEIAFYILNSPRRQPRQRFVNRAPPSSCSAAFLLFSVSLLLLRRSPAPLSAANRTLKSVSRPVLGL